MPESNSLIFYNNSDRAERYHQKKGFAPERTATMHEVMLDLLTTLTSPQSTVLELGAGTGLFTQKLLRTHHFRELYVTDGAAAMLQIARQTLEAEQTLLHFIQLDFTTDWPGLFAGIGFDAVTSSIALHHAADKQQLFQQIFSILKPQGVFVLADHMAGATAWIEHLLARERAMVRLGKENKENYERLQEIMRVNADVGRKEGNVCESVAQYQSYLNQSGFEDAECIWRDYWLAVFVARKHP
ncbi:MAG: class I SAM-dependent methyltransferase [Omnitrophica WOR_2 bacterium]